MPSADMAWLRVSSLLHLEIVIGAEGVAFHRTALMRAPSVPTLSIIQLLPPQTCRVLSAAWIRVLQSSWMAVLKGAKRSRASKSNL